MGVALMRSTEQVSWMIRAVASTQAANDSSAFDVISWASRNTQLQFNYVGRPRRMADFDRPRPNRT
jgi:hypothetical protein